MIIKTKFEPGQEVWVMQDNKPINLFVYSINIVAGLDFNKQITYAMIYNLANGRFGGNFEENKIYTTKEDLKNNLFNTK